MSNCSCNRLRKDDKRGNKINTTADLHFSYLAGIGAFAQTSTKHAVGDMVAVNIWLSANVVRDQSDSGLLQTGVTLGLCQIKARQW